MEKLPASKEGLEMMKLSLPVLIAGSFLFYGEINWWNSMVVFIPGIIIYPVIFGIGAVGMSAGLIVSIFGAKNKVKDNQGSPVYAISGFIAAIASIFLLTISHVGGIVLTVLALVLSIIGMLPGKPLRGLGIAGLIIAGFIIIIFIILSIVF